MKPSTPLSASPSKGKLSSTKQAPSTKKVGGHCPRSSWSSWLTLYWRTEEACHPLWRKLEEWHYISSSLIVNMDGTHLVGPWWWNWWPAPILSPLAILCHLEHHCSCWHSSLLTTLQGDATPCPWSSECVVSLCSHPWWLPLLLLLSGFQRPHYPFANLSQ